MTGFALKELENNPKVGDKLKTARLKKRLSIEDISKKLQIRAEYLLALEQEEYQILPSGLYGKQFLKEYCHFLNLDFKKIVTLTPFNTNKEENNPFSQKILRKYKFLVFPKLIRNLIFITLFLVCLLYLLIYFRQLISPPKLDIEYPNQNLVTTELSIEIKGKSDPETEIQINNSSIMSAKDGSFSQEIKLKKGLNKLTISAKKKYGEESIIQRQILVE